METGTEVAIAMDTVEAEQARPAIFIAAASILGITLLLTMFEAPGIPCFFKTVLQVPCAGCGLTRSLKAIWTGDLALSFRYHALGVPLFAACLSLLGLSIAGARYRQRAVEVLMTRQVWLAVLGALLAAWVVKLAGLLSGPGFFLD